MLVFTRTLEKPEIVIGKDGEVVVKIISVRGNQVRIAIEAPRCIPVHRREVFDRISLEDETLEK